MPSNAWTPLANLTLGTNQATVTFSSISQSYRDLVLIINSTHTASGNYSSLRANNDSSSNYHSIIMQGNGSSVASQSGTWGEFYPFYGLQEGTNIFQASINIMDYSATDKHKTFLIRSNATSVATMAQGNRWSNTSAISTLTISSSGNFASGSTFTLYGVSA